MSYLSPSIRRGEFAGFVLREAVGNSPSVVVDSYGYVGLEWIIPDPFASRLGSAVVQTRRSDDHVWGRGDGVLGLWFLPGGMVRVCGTSGPVGQGVERMRVNSVVPLADVMGEVRTVPVAVGVRVKGDVIPDGGHVVRCCISWPVLLRENRSSLCCPA